MSRLTSTTRRATVGLALTPTATLSVSKMTANNPTMAFAGDGTGIAPESIVRVGGTYWTVYAGMSSTTLRLASAPSLVGPWADYGAVLTAGGGWEASQYLYAPWLMEDAGTFYLFYSTVPSAGGGTGGSIGVATASAVTGAYTKYGSNPILTVTAPGTWDSLRVGECSVINVGGTWVMAYMGETTAVAYQASEKVGIATAPGATGPWTRADGNPLITWGNAGAWDDALSSDPSLFYENGTYWCWYTGGRPSPWKAGLAYASDPSGPWTKLAANPLLSPTAATFDASGSWRGCVYRDGGTYHVIYAGFDGSAVRGGNAILNVS